MRLLFLTSRLPYPPNRGDRLRAFNFLRSLSQDHDIDLVSFITDESERAYLDELQAYCDRVQVLEMSPMRSALTVGVNLWRRLPLQVLYYRSEAMKQLVGQILESGNYALVYVHLFRMAPYVAEQDGIYRVVDLTDVISQELIRSMPYRGLSSRFLYAVERPRIEKYERWVAGHFEETWLISEVDKQVLAMECLDENVQVIRNGVDTEGLHPTGERERPNSLILVGHMGVFHNVDAAVHLVEDILPLVRKEIPDCTLKLVGAEPNARVRELGKEPGVIVTGFVPDLNEVLNQAAVFVAPLRFAAGVQNKVLEAMAAGCPVVTTTLVNQGLGAQRGRDVFIGDHPEAIAELLLTLLRNRDLRKKIGHAGREFVQKHYNWSLVRQRVNEIANLLDVGSTHNT
jgi:sugar transferase (PEP-CTERM/EpsH1 system associated)